jgi:hypothetical protein
MIIKKSEPQFLPSIAICLLLDLAGMLTYTLPALGEFADIVWAPISAIMFYKLFGGRLGTVGSVFNFLEEIVPFTDFIPSFTIAWFIRKNEIVKSRLQRID